MLSNEYSEWNPTFQSKNRVDYWVGFHSIPRTFKRNRAPNAECNGWRFSWMSFNPTYVLKSLLENSLRVEPSPLKLIKRPNRINRVNNEGDSKSHRDPFFLQNSVSFLIHSSFLPSFPSSLHCLSSHHGLLYPGIFHLTPIPRLIKMNWRSMRSR